MSTTYFNPLQAASNGPAGTQAKPGPYQGQRADQTSKRPSGSVPLKQRADLKGEGIRRNKEVDFEAVRERASNWTVQILEHLDPQGELRGSEYVMLNPRRRDGELGSFSFNVDKCIGKDFASDESFGDIIQLVAHFRHLSQPAAGMYVEALVQGWEAAGPAKARKPKKEAEGKYGVQVLPVPSDAPLPLTSHYELGPTSKTWRYVTTTGETAGYVARFETATGKTTRPMTLRKFSDGQIRWMWKGFDGLRPLYNLHELSTRIEAPVLIVEGEKAADAARQLLPDFVVVTTMHGSQSPQQTDLTPLAGRSVLIWPDHDEAGQKYLNAVVGLLQEIDPLPVVKILRSVSVSAGFDEAGKPRLEPGFVPSEGWDAADAVEAGWTPEHAALLVAESSDASDVSKPSVYSHLPLPTDLGNFLAENFPHGLAYVNESFLAYQDGCWRELDDRSEVRHRVACFLGKSAHKAKDITNMFDRLKDFMAKSESGTQPNRNFICLQNGTLSTQSCKLVPHDPVYGLRSRIPASWKPEARCDRWLTFLDEIFKPDADKEGKIQFLQEWFGYCLAADASQHKFLWLVGGGGNGKSVLLAVLQQLVGTENVSHAHLERLHEGYVRAELDGKLVNISSEMSAEATLADGYFKAIVSGDIIEAARKFKPSFSFRPFIKLVGATNHLPRLLDLSDGFFRRAIVLTFNRQFTETEQEKDLESKLLLELDGILNWAIQGLQRLRERGKFVDLPSSLATLEEYRVESDPIRMFADECLATSEDEGMKAREIYTAYAEWCKGFGFKAKANSMFGKRLKELGFVSFRSSQGNCWRVREQPGNPHLNIFGASERIVELPTSVPTPGDSLSVLPNGLSV